MLCLQHYEARLACLKQHHPDMPLAAISLVRFVVFLQRRLEDRLGATLEQYGLNHSAWSLLMMIYSDPRHAINPSAASETLRQSRPHMTRMTDELAERGWVERVHDAVDRRAVEVRLTASGEQAVQGILPAMWAEYEALVAGFSPEETAGLATLVRQWLRHLETDSAAASTAHDKESA